MGRSKFGWRSVDIRGENLWFWVVVSVVFFFCFGFRFFICRRDDNVCFVVGFRGMRRRLSFCVL